MDYNDLCISCFQKKGPEVVCVSCGYAEEARNATYLKARTLLSNRYLIGEISECDSISTKYKALDTVSNRLVEVCEYFPSKAVRRNETDSCVIPSNEQMFKKSIDRVRRNAKKLMKLSDSVGVINIFDCFDENNTFYIVTEYLEGMYLHDYIASCGGRLDEQTALTIIIAVLDGLSVIHKAGMVHREIDTRSIFISVDNKIKIVNFSFLEDASPYKESKMTTVFVPGYTAPEQYSGVGKQGEFTDIYSAGAVLYRMLTGVRPIDALSRFSGERLDEPSELNPEINRKIELAIQKAMCMDVELRFKTASDFKSTLIGQKEIFNIDGELKQIKKTKRKTGIAVAVICLLLGVAIFLYFKYK